MTKDITDIRLTELSPLLKFVFTLFLVMIGVSYMVSMFNLYLTYHLTDGDPGLTIEDLRRSFYGNRNQTLLASKIDGGSMEQYLPSPGAKEAILSWIQDGTPKTGFKEVEHIFENRCVRCHNPNGLMWKRPLTTFELVKEVTVVDRGEPVSLWARVAHTHLMSLAVVFFGLSIIFSLCGAGQKMKTFLMPLPFLALFVDFGSRALIKYIPAFVYVMAGAGALMGLSMAVLIVAPLYEMWIRGNKVKPES
ncbi:hypothetical protein GWO43_31045 [candidate division KSB1 bacterium]|nr:hypothetical protein [candidate division KSB1 bacterium]NIV71014.1 hypothetical protein [Phycisphaerae bacterium]NIR70003.1 hypothetical protein [candidate division KSB1 bacterium]NIS27487.1 hypothetical protein [candidate division KSB1 bacterium]NIT75219.1 hypothetical protein [candidate division KSB1 bacterium]